MLEPTAEDEILITLAKSARARTGAVEGAAVRDVEGRTYVGCPVTLPSLRLTALQVAVAFAVSSGVDDLTVGVVVTDAAHIDSASIAALRDVSTAALLLRVDMSGVLLERE